MRALVWLAILVGCNRSTTDSPPAASHVTVSAAPASSSAVVEKAHVRLIEADQDSDALSTIRTKRLEAKAESRVLVVYVGATWCEPCKRFKAEVQSGRLDDRLGKVTLLAFDDDKDVDRLGAAGYTFKFIPYVALPGVDGRPSDTQQATGKGGDAWRELLGKLESWSR